MSYLYTFKFIVVGDTHVGKSCLLKRFSDGTFSTSFETTIGVEFGARIISVMNKDIKLQVWDTAGQEIFRTITKQYYRCSCAALVVYDITKRTSFINIDGWVREIKAANDQNTPIILIGNKTDMGVRREVETDEAEEYARQHGFLFRELSVKQDSDSGMVFNELAEDVLKKIDSGELVISPEQGIKLATQVSCPDIESGTSIIRSKCCTG